MVQIKERVEIEYLGLIKETIPLLKILEKRWRARMRTNTKKRRSNTLETSFGGDEVLRLEENSSIAPMDKQGTVQGASSILLHGVVVWEEFIWGRSDLNKYIFWTRQLLNQPAWFNRQLNRFDSWIDFVKILLSFVWFAQISLVKMNYKIIFS